MSINSRLLPFALLSVAAFLFSFMIMRDKRLRIMTYNVRNCIGMDSKRDFQRVASVIMSQSPDIVALQELDSATGRSNRSDVLNELSTRTGYHAVYAPAIPFDGGKYGIGILSKVKPLLSWMVPLPGTEERRMLQVVEYDKYVVFNVHLSLTEADRLLSAEIINQELKKLTKPVFLAGDFNDEPGSSTIKALITDKWKLMSDKDPTFPADKPDRCIDYIFSSQKYKVRRAQVVKAPVASDHRPVWVDFRYR